MTSIRKNLIRHVAALDLLQDEIRALSKWGPAAKLTEEEHWIASLASGEARKILIRLRDDGERVDPVGIRPDWRELAPSPEELRGDVMALCKIIGEHGLEVLHDRKKLRGYFRILREK